MLLLTAALLFNILDGFFESSSFYTAFCKMVVFVAFSLTKILLFASDTSTGISPDAFGEIPLEKPGRRSVYVWENYFWKSF